MKFAQRRKMILDLLQNQDTVTLQQLIQQLGSSEATIRRDVTRMEEQGELRRCWGGVKRVDTPESIRQGRLQKQQVNASHMAIGQIAASQLQDNELIFIGSGMTTLAMIPFIDKKGIHVITNGIPQMEALQKKGIQTLLLCGFFKEYSRSLVGKETLELLRSYKFDRAFLGANGIDDDWNPLSADTFEDGIKTLCIRQARKAYLLVEQSKFHRTAYYMLPHEVARDVTVITDAPIHNPSLWTKQGDGYYATIGQLSGIE